MEGENVGRHLLSTICVSVRNGGQNSEERFRRIFEERLGSQGRGARQDSAVGVQVSSAYTVVCHG